MKTKKAAAKRMRVMGSGRIKMTQAGKRHCMRKRSKDMLRNSRGMKTLTTCEMRRMARALVLRRSKLRLYSNRELIKMNPGLAHAIADSVASISSAAE